MLRVATEQNIEWLRKEGDVLRYYLTFFLEGVQESA
jgi:hypothetical protein